MRSVRPSGAAGAGPTAAGMVGAKTPHPPFIFRARVCI